MKSFILFILLLNSFVFGQESALTKLEEMARRIDSLITANLMNYEVSIYTLAEIDSLLSMIANGDSLNYTAEEVNSLLEMMANGVTLNYTAEEINSLLDIVSSSNSTITKSAYDIQAITYADTFMVFWPDDDIIIDSIKCISNGSVRIQMKIEGLSTTNLFTSAVFINGITTLKSFSDANLAADDKVYLYFTYIGNTATRLGLKIYWRYM